MLFSSYIVIRTTSSWMRSCPITSFDTKKPMSKNCLVLSLILHLHHEACWCSEFWKQFLIVIQGQKKLFTVISTCTLCQSDGREYSLYMRAWLTVFTLRWCLATLMLAYNLQQLVCERSAASTIFSQRLVLNVQNRSKMQHSGRVRSVSCHTRCESVVHCLSAPLPESGHQAYTTRRRTPWMSKLSYRLLHVKALVWESLP